MKTPILFIAMLACLLAASNAFAQSIEESWMSAPKEKTPPARQSTQQSAQPFLQTDRQYRAWDRRVEGTDRTWTPRKPAVTVPGDYYTSNGQLIDSLTTLYCLSSNYLTTLRNRNEAARSGVVPAAPTPRDFHYQQSVPGHTPIPGRESPEALHKELLQLLEQCLYGRY